MPRRAKTTEPENNSQAAPPLESQEDRLVRVGMAMWLTWDATEGTTTKEQLDWQIEHFPKVELESLSVKDRNRYLELGKKDPRPSIERLKESCHKLLELCKSHEEEKLLVKQMQSSLADLEVVLLVRRYGGRPKGTGKKVTPDIIENIRKWKAGDRTWVSGSSVKEVANKLNVSRQTVYTILEEIKAEADNKRDNPAVADEST